MSTKVRVADCLRNNDKKPSTHKVSNVDGRENSKTRKKKKKKVTKPS